MSLAVKYRPKVFEDVCSQTSVVETLKRQVANREFSNAYILCGASGCGKTTLARIMAREINKGMGSPIELDSASNNSVDAMRRLAEEAKQRSLDSEYKVFILDECHALSIQAFQVALKMIEETPKYTIFFFCTTNPEKIPATIINRCMKFQLNRIPSDIIRERLCYISSQEGFTGYEDSCDYISRICNGEMRQGIALLEKIAAHDKNMDIAKTTGLLGNVSHATMIALIDKMIDGNEPEVLRLLSEVNDTGIDLRIWLNSFIQFTLDVQKFLLLSDIRCTRLPSSLINDINRIINFNNASGYYNYLLENLLSLKGMVTKDSDPFSTIQIMFLKMARCK